MSDNNVIAKWLKSLGLDKYVDQFLDNGYDDLEICKQIGADDLDAIGVEEADRDTILNSVKDLKEKTVTSAYHTLENEQQNQEEKKVLKFNGSSNPGPGTPTTAPVRPTLDDLISDVPPPTPANGAGLGDPSQGQGERSLVEGQLLQNMFIEYPKTQLTLLLRDKVFEDRIDLAGPPYTAQVIIF